MSRDSQAEAKHVGAGGGVVGGETRYNSKRNPLQTMCDSPNASIEPRLFPGLWRRELATGDRV